MPYWIGPHGYVDLSGTWKLNRQRSTSDDQLLKQLGYNWLLRRAFQNMDIYTEISHAEVDKVVLVQRSRLGDTEEVLYIDNKPHALGNPGTNRSVVVTASFNQHNPQGVLDQIIVSRVITRSANKPVVLHLTDLYYIEETANTLVQFVELKGDNGRVPPLQVTRVYDRISETPFGPPVAAKLSRSLSAGEGVAVDAIARPTRADSDPNITSPAAGSAVVKPRPVPIAVPDHPPRTSTTPTASGTAASVAPSTRAPARTDSTLHVKHTVRAVGLVAVFVMFVLACSFPHVLLVPLVLVLGLFQCCGNKDLFREPTQPWGALSPSPRPTAGAFPLTSDTTPEVPIPADPDAAAVAAELEAFDKSLVYDREEPPAVIRQRPPAVDDE